MSEPTILTLQGTELTHSAGPTGYSAVPEQDAKKPFSDPMVYRVDVLEREARGVLDIIVEYARQLAAQHVNDDDFVPEDNKIAPARYRRHKVRMDQWPIAGIIGKTGLSNWKNMVNKAVVAARAQIEMSQNNGTWLLERYETGIAPKGRSREEVLFVDLWFVDARNADDLEWRDGAPVKAEHRRSDQLTTSSLVSALRAAAAPKKKKGAKAAAPVVEEDDDEEEEEEEVPAVEEPAHPKRAIAKPVSNADKLSLPPPPLVKA